MIRVMHVGLGPIGALVARQIASRTGFRIVGAVDADPKKAGRDVGDVIDAGRKLRVPVTADISRTIKAAAILDRESSRPGADRRCASGLVRPHDVLMEDGRVKP